MPEANHVITGLQSEPDKEPTVLVRMGAPAAASLADACQWATHRAVEEWDDESLPNEKRQKAMKAYEWLSWGARWLVGEAGRKPGELYLVDDCTPETIGVFTTFEKAMEFAVAKGADRIRVGELDKSEWAPVRWEFHQWTNEWEEVGPDA